MLRETDTLYSPRFRNHNTIAKRSQMIHAYFSIMHHCGRPFRNGGSRIFLACAIITSPTTRCRGEYGRILFPLLVTKMSGKTILKSISCYLAYIGHVDYASGGNMSLYNATGPFFLARRFSESWRAQSARGLLDHDRRWWSLAKRLTVPHGSLHSFFSKHPLFYTLCFF